MTDLSNFSYSLPENLIAHYPTEKRDQSRLMVVDRATGTIKHCLFSEFPRFLKKDDFLVFNNSKVFPARLFGSKNTGGKVEALLLEEVKDRTWTALVKGAKVREGTTLFFKDGVSGRIMNRAEDGRVSLCFEGTDNFLEWLNSNGVVPIPPYIKRAPSFSFDSLRYQTIYASERGSVAAPTAGLHFTKKVQGDLEDKGIGMAYVTLHVGIGTFRPVKVSNIEEHVMDHERFAIEPTEKEKIETAIRENKRVIAVGSTSMRTLEFSVREGGVIDNCSGRTDIFIKPGHRFAVAGGMLTNFHLPESTLFILVCAFAGIPLMQECYQTAIREKYRFYSYGDAMLIL